MAGVVHRPLVQRHEYFAFRSGIAFEQRRNIEVVSIRSIQLQDPVFQSPCPRGTVRPFERAPFGPLRLSTFGYEHVGPPEQVIVSRFLSVSFIAALPETEKNAVAAQLRELVASHPALKGKEQVALPYRTEAYLAEAR